MSIAYYTKDIVWVKIVHYPWWPGKVIDALNKFQIIQIGSHKSEIFYKISFYADSTYCYVKQNELIPYSQFNSSFNNNFQITTQLKKAIQLANNAFIKQKYTQNKNNQQIFIKNHDINKLNTQNHHQIHFNTDNLTKQHVQHKINIQSSIKVNIDSVIPIVIDEIYQQQKVQNIFEQKLERSIKMQDLEQSTMLIYAKQTENIKNLQKYSLLSLLKQYKLDNIPKINQIALNIQNMKSSNAIFSQQELINQENSGQGSILKQKKIKKIIKLKSKSKRKELSNQQNQIKYIRKLNNCLISKFFSIQFCRQMSIKIVDKINRKYTQKSERYYGYVSVLETLIRIQTIQQLEQSMKIYEVITCPQFPICKSSKVIDSPKSSICKQDEQRSKFTQIQRVLSEEIYYL